MLVTHGVPADLPARDPRDGVRRLSLGVHVLRRGAAGRDL
jgi:hypothetical protein